MDPAYLQRLRGHSDSLRAATLACPAMAQRLVLAEHFHDNGIADGHSLGDVTRDSCRGACGSRPLIE